MTTAMRIERAQDTYENLDTAIGLIDAASGWLRTKDTDQWAEPWPSREARDGRVHRDIVAGKTWFLRDGDTVAAMVTLAMKAIPDVWKGSLCVLDEPAVYVHRLVTARGYTGLGLGAALIDWAGRRGRLYYGAKWIRIDVWTTNKRLHKYYENQQFEPCGLCTDEEYPSGALFQKSVSTIEGPAVIPHADDDSVEFDLACPVPGRRELVLT